MQSVIYIAKAIAIVTLSFQADAEKLYVPSKDALAEPQKILEDRFTIDQRSTAAEVSQAVSDLKKIAESGNTTGPEKYAILLKLEKISLITGDDELWLWSIDQIRKGFVVDEWKDTTTRLLVFAEAHSVKFADSKLLARTRQLCAGRALSGEADSSLEFLKKLYDSLGSRSAKRSVARDLASLVELLKERATQEGMYLKATEIIKDNPNDENSNFVMGAYHAAVTHDWLKAVQAFEKCGRPLFVDAAKHEKSAVSHEFIGDAWGKVASSFEKPNSLSHAVTERAIEFKTKELADATALSKVKIQAEIETLKNGLRDKTSSLEWIASGRLGIQKVEVAAAANNGPGNSASNSRVAEKLFNGRNLEGWRGVPGLWSVKNGMIVGSTYPKGIAKPTFLVFEKEFQDFELTLKVRMGANAIDSGLNFRSGVADTSMWAMWGPQCNFGFGTTQKHPWGTVFFQGHESVSKTMRFDMQESNKNLVMQKVVKDGFNELRLRCVGNHVTVGFNGSVVLDTDIPKLPKSGQIGLQLRGDDGPMEIFVKDIELVEL